MENPAAPPPLPPKPSIPPSITPPPEPVREPLFSVKFIVFTVAVVGLAALAGSYKSSKQALDHFFSVPKLAAAAVPAAPATQHSPAPVAVATQRAQSATSVPAVVSTPRLATVPPQVAVKPAASAASTTKPSAAPTAIATPKPGTVAVTAISLGVNSIAIINGVSHVEGDILKTPEATGWRVARILDGGVILQKGDVFYPLRLTPSGLKPLNDALQPLN